VKKLLALAMGVATGAGAYLEVGTIVTSAQAGARFGTHLLWAVVLGGAALLALLELVGRLSASGDRSAAEALRDRFGAGLAAVPRLVLSLVGLMILAAELAGAALAIELVAGVGARLTVMPIAITLALLLWKGPGAISSRLLGAMGLVGVLFFLALRNAHPPVALVASGLVPRAAPYDSARHWYLVLAIIGASATPFLFLLASGLRAPHRAADRISVVVGTALAAAVLLIGAATFAPLGLDVQHVRQLPSLLQVGLGRWGYLLFAGVLGVGCLGAALATALAVGRLGLWTARPVAAQSLALVAGAGLVMSGVDVLGLTTLAMAVAALALPLLAVAFVLVLVDGRQAVREGRAARLDLSRA
jgi:Mn2+/Fe2+ NRAMP family transporter